jgi:uncharacterized membrane protein
MLMFKKVVAAIFMVLAVISVVALIVGLFGSWVARARLETTSIELLLSGERAIAVSREGLGRVDGVLQRSSGAVAEVAARVQSAGTRVVESDPLIQTILEPVAGDLLPRIESAVEIFNQVEANVVAINDAIDAVAAIPVLGLSSSLPDQTKLREVEDSMAQIRGTVQSTRDAVERLRTEIIQGKVSEAMAITSRVNQTLTSTQASITELDARLAENAAAMAALRERIPGLYTLITILLNLIMLLTIVAFVSLFLHAYQYYKCTQDGLRGLLPEDCAAAPAAG